MLRILATLSLVLGSLGLGLGARAAAPEPLHAVPAEQTADPRAALLKLLPAGSKAEDLQPSPIPGIYQFAQGSDISYLTADGKYFLDGNLYDMNSRENLTEAQIGRAHV